MKRALLAAALVLSIAPAAQAAQGDRPHDNKPAPSAAATPTPPPPGPPANRPSQVEGGTLYVIQPRAYHPGHEFRIASGYLPQDAFYKGTTADFSYTYHFSDAVSWEVFRGVYSWNHDTDLVRRLRDEFKVTNDPYEKVQYLISTHAQLTPFYGKQTLFNRGVVHQELYFLAGPGGVGWVIHENGRADRPKNFRPAFDLGFGFRWYASRFLSFKLEGIENFFQKEDGSIDEQVYVTLGVSMSSNR